MKLKELKRTVNVSWSPAEHYPVLLAAGSAAQQVDASFSTSSVLEVYSLNLQDPGLDLELKSSLQTQHKFQKLVWSGAGILVGGCDGGLLEFYGAEKLIKNSPDALLGSTSKHNGHVSALDINPYQKNLFASGASDSEIFIWDLNNTTQPMAPGNKSQPYEHVQGLAWNQQVQHILGSTFASRCVVWDLRKNEPIMKLSDSVSRTRWRALAWHPDVATQLCIASEDDQVPVVQLWDLRLAASPLMTMEGHQKGVMALSWCRQDSGLLLSAGKDGRVLCWNPNSNTPGGEVVLEVEQQAQWVLDVAWSPRVPALLAAASFGHQLSLHALLGGSRPHLSSQEQNNIMDSFGGADGFSSLPAVAPPPTAESQPSPQPTRPPAWLKRPAAAKFAFGGKLVTFEKSPQEAGSQKIVYISQVVSEPEIIDRAAELDTILSSSLSQDPSATEMLAEYCRARGDACSEQRERYMWFLLRANFLPSFRTEVLNLLGFKQDEIPSRFKGQPPPSEAAPDPNSAALSRGESTETEAELSTDTSTDLSDAHTLIERKLSNLDLEPTVSNVTIPNGEDSTSVICRALASGQLEEAVELCLDARRTADALLIASLGSQELVQKVQRYHVRSAGGEPVALLADCVLRERWTTLVQSTAAVSWRSVLATLLTHCHAEALHTYCEMLGDKLAQESDPALSEAASVCYLCAMSADALLERWRRGAAGDAGSLAQLAERALLARRAAAARGRPTKSGGQVEGVLCELAWRLAAQGGLTRALHLLDGVQRHDLRDRLQHALGLVQPVHVQQPAGMSQYSRTRTVSTHSQKRTQRGSHDVSNTYNTVPGAYEQQPWQSQAQPPSAFPPQPPSAFQPQPPSAFQQQPPSAFQPQAPPAFPPQQPSAFPPQPPLQQPQLSQPPTQPSRPSSVGPHSGGITSRSKYKVDPSVQSAPLYNQYSFNNATQPSYGYNSPLPDQYSNASVPNPGFAPVNNQMNQMNPVNQLNPANQLNPVNSSNQLNPGNQFNQVNQLNPSTAVNGGYYGQQQEQAPPAPSKPVPPGWNDPPMLTSKPKRKSDASAPQAPITHPLFGSEPPQHVPLQPQLVPNQYADPYQYPPQQQQGPPQQQLGPPQQQQGPPLQPQYASQPQPYPLPQQQYAPQQQYNAPQAYPQAESPAPAPAVEPVEKPPLPEQHTVLQTVFDGLRQQCCERAHNPQMKRKLEDVQRRLETLYDLLREYRLSESATSALHECAEAASRGDYAGAAAAATALAAGTDFAAAAAFLPGLKVLLQLAAQLQVQLR